VPAERLEILADIAQVQEAALADPAATFATWARALSEDPSSQEARAALERLAESGSNLAGLAQVYEERLKAVYDSELQRWFGSRLAEIYETKLGKPERAVELWREIETLPGSEGVALARQETLLRSLGRMQDLADVLAREAEVATDASTQAEYWAALGELRLGALADRDGAISAFRSAMDCQPKQERAIAALRTLVVGMSQPWRRSTSLSPWRKSKPISPSSWPARSTSEHRG
jgi:tetratricopeptide (TPR) repeat protein